MAYTELSLGLTCAQTARLKQPPGGFYQEVMISGIFGQEGLSVHDFWPYEIFGNRASMSVFGSAPAIHSSWTVPMPHYEYNEW
eukprot:scaffold7789_cov41-Cyclotella_meneghiniana.AAC.1